MGDENPRPTLENLGRLLEGYGATAMGLVLAMEEGATARAKAEDRGPSDEELIQALADAIRRIDQAETDSRIEQLEKELGRTAG